MKDDTKTCYFRHQIDMMTLSVLLLWLFCVHFIRFSFFVYYFVTCVVCHLWTFKKKKKKRNTLQCSDSLAHALILKSFWCSNYTSRDVKHETRKIYIYISTKCPGLG